jgi:hypothetical protein
MNAEDPVWADLRTSAGRLGALAWTERRISAHLATLVAGVEDPELCLVAASLGRRSAERAEVVRARLPELRELPVDELVRPAGPSWRAVLDGVGHGSAPTVVAGLGRSVLPVLADAYRSVADAASPVAEPSVIRHLGPLAEQVAADAALAREATRDATEPPDLAGLLSAAHAEGGVVGR